MTNRTGTLLILLICLGCAQPQGRSANIEIPYTYDVESQTKESLLEHVTPGYNFRCTAEAKAIGDKYEVNSFVRSANLHAAMAKLNECKIIAGNEIQNRIKKRLLELSPNWSKKEKQAVSNSQTYIGMSSDAFMAIMGKPMSINHTALAHKLQEQWVYSSSVYAYFSNGKLTSLQY